MTNQDWARRADPHAGGHAKRRPDRRVYFLTLLWLVGLAGLLAACQNSSSQPPLVVTRVVEVEGEEVVVTRVVMQTVQMAVTPITDPETNRPVELDISYRGYFPILDPQRTANANAQNLMENLFIGLTRYNHEANTVEPALASSWTVGDNGRVWTFHLRDDVAWVRPVTPVANLPLARASDTLEVRAMRPLNADDIVFTIQRICDRRTAAPDSFLLFIVEGCELVNGLATPTPADIAAIGVRALDDLTVQITLTKPASHFLTLTSTTLLRPVPAELVTDSGDNWSRPGNLWSSGPFVLSPRSVGTTLTVLQRNPFWPLASQGNVDTVNILHLDDDTDAFELWENRSLDLSPLPSAQRSAILRRHSARALLVPSQTVFYLGFNFNSPVFRSVEVRRAFSAAIDRERLLREVYGGRGLPMRHFTPPGVLGAPPFTEVGTGYSPDYARQQMAASPYRDCRFMPPITYLVSSSDLALQQAEVVREMWMDVLGCNQDQIIIEQVQFGTLMANTRRDAPPSLRPDLWDLGWDGFYPDAHNWLGDVLHCTDSENRQSRSCSEADDLIRRAATTQSLAERERLYRQAENTFFGPDGLQPIAPLFAQANYILRHLWVNHTPALFGGEQYDTYLVDGAIKDLERNR
jgi:oligopeptide transport system substrate-binding protein